MRRLLVVALFADLGRLAGALAQVIELGTTNIAALQDLKLRYRWAVHRERALNSYAVGQLANGVRLGNA